MTSIIHGKALSATAGVRHAARVRRAYQKVGPGSGSDLVLMAMLAEALDRIDALEAEVKAIKFAYQASNPIRLPITTGTG